MVHILKTLTILIAGLVVLLGALWVSLKWYFWEPSNFTRESWAYKLKVDSAIKEFPIWGPVSAPVYLVQVADGPKRSTVAMSYETTFGQKRLLSEIEKLEFACEHDSAQRYIVCEKEGEAGCSISIMIRSGKGSSNLTIEVTFLGFGGV